MESQENPNKETPQSETSTSETKPIAKNPWWVKIIPHYFIVSYICYQIVNPQSIINIIGIIAWIYIGGAIRKNEIIPSVKIIILFVFLIAFNLPRFWMDIKSIYLLLF
jgi:hypothetical protein